VILDSTLNQLETAQLVRRSIDEEATYLFRHALTQDATYHTLLKNQRRELHRHIAHAYEELYAHQLDEFATVLGQHFAQAGERDKAVHYLRQAARLQVTRFAYAEATHDLELALALFKPEEVNENLLALLEELGDAYRLRLDSARAVALYQQSLAVWSHVEGAARLIKARLHRKIIQVALDFMWTAEREWEEWNRIAAESQVELQAELGFLADAPPDPEIVHVLSALSVFAWRIQSPPDWAAALSFAQDAVTMAEGLAVPMILSRALDALANIYDARNRLREHLQMVSRRLALAQSAAFDDPREKTDALRGMGMAHMYVGEYQAALPFLREAEQLAEDIQAHELHTYATALQAQCLFRLDRWDEVLALEEKWRGLEQRYSREQVGVT
jgi:predicted ATPase